MTSLEGTAKRRVASATARLAEVGCTVSGGSTGTSTGNHLHFQVEIRDNPVDPVPFMRDRGAPLEGTKAANPHQTDETAVAGAGRTGEGGVGFDLPKQGTPRQDRLPWHGADATSAAHAG